MVEQHHADAEVDYFGTVCILHTKTLAAHQWAFDHLPASAMRWGGGVVVEPRCIEDVIAGMENDGLAVCY